MIKVTMTFETYDEMLAQFGAVRLDSINEIEETRSSLDAFQVVQPGARGATAEMAASREIPGVKDAPAPEPPAVEPEPEKVVVPRAQELADKYGIDPMTLPASGKGNRVLLSDVQKAVDSMGVSTKPDPEPEAAPADDTEYTVDHGRIATSFLVEAKGMPAAESLLGEYDAKRVKDVQDMNGYVKRCIEESGKSHSDWQTYLADKMEAA